MNNPAKIGIKYLKSLLVKSLLFTLLSILSLSSQAEHKKTNQLKKLSVMFVFAHPDDETWVSGSLAMAAKQGHDINTVYVTSGEAGRNILGNRWKGAKLAEAREKESLNALQTLGIKKAPVFLHLPDSQLSQKTVSKQAYQAILDTIAKVSPHIIITFGPDGVTNHHDHIEVGELVRRAADKTQTVKMVMNIAMSEQRKLTLAQRGSEKGIDLSKVVHIDAVNNRTVNYRINVKPVSIERGKSFQFYKTQFPLTVIQAWQHFTAHEHTEEFIVARSHLKSQGKHDELIKRLFGNIGSTDSQTNLPSKTSK